MHEKQVAAGEPGRDSLEHAPPPPTDGLSSSDLLEPLLASAGHESDPGELQLGPLG